MSVVNPEFIKFMKEAHALLNHGLFGITIYQISFLIILILWLRNRAWDEGFSAGEVHQKWEHIRRNPPPKKSK